MTTTNDRNKGGTVRTHSEIHRSGPHAGRRVWVREYLNAQGQCDRFEIFAAEAVS